MANHHVIIRSGQLTIELQAQDGPFMARELDAWSQALLAKTVSPASSLPAMPTVALPAENPTIPESVVIPLPKAAEAVQSDAEIGQTAQNLPIAEATPSLAANDVDLTTTDAVLTEFTQESAHDADMCADNSESLATEPLTVQMPEALAEAPQDVSLESPLQSAPQIDALDPTADLLAESPAVEVQLAAPDINPVADVIVDEAATSTQPALPPELEAFYGNSKGEAEAALTPESPAPANDDFSLVLNQVMADFEDGDDTATLLELDEPAEPAEMAQPTGLIESLADLCDVVHPENAEELLLAAGYYLTFFEGKDSFSLKQLNSQLLLANESSISHSVLAKAIEADCLTLVPDPTGSVETPEYALTPASRQLVEGWLKGQR